MHSSLDILLPRHQYNRPAEHRLHAGTPENRRVGETLVSPQSPRPNARGFPLCAAFEITLNRILQR
jgi:hypothetical protein